MKKIKVNRSYKLKLFGSKSKFEDLSWSAKEYIGPTAVKKISKYLTPIRIKKAMKRINVEERGLCLKLIDTIKETANMTKGYLVFS